jgi:hypothetical protein
MLDPFHLEAYGETTVNYNRDIEAFPILNSLFDKILGESPYKSPTDMGVNMVGNCIVDETVVCEASKNEILRRYYQVLKDRLNGKIPEDVYYKMNMILKQSCVNIDSRQVIKYALEKESMSGCISCAIELEDGTIIQGRQTETLSSASAVILNALKYLAPALSDLRFLNFSLKMSNYDFYENYVTLKEEKFDIVVTSKVGLFLPLSDVGLMIMLDSDNYNYISEQTPKYDSQKVLEFRRNYHNAKLIYTTNSPNLGLYHDAIYGKVTFLKYNVNANNKFHLINERESTLKGEFDSGVSRDVLVGVRNALSEKKKAILMMIYPKYYISTVKHSKVLIEKQR